MLTLLSWYVNVGGSVGCNGLKRTVRDHSATINLGSVIHAFPNNSFHFVFNIRLQPYYIWVGAGSL